MNIPYPGRHLRCLLMAVAMSATAMLAVLPAHAASDTVAYAGSGDLLSLQAAMRLATQNQPLLQSFEDAANASREAAVVQQRLPDPRLKFGVINLPITSSDAFRFDRDEMTMAAIGLAQEVVPRARREARARVLETEAEQYHTEQLVTARSIQREVAMAWLDVFEAQRKSELYQQIVDNMVIEREVAASRISAGGVQASEILLLDRQQSMVRDQRLLAQRDERKARAELARWIGRDDAARPVGSDLALMQPDLNAASTIEQHPVLQNARQIETVAMTEIQRANTERLPSWGWEVGYGRRFNDLSDMITFQLAFDLQTDRANRQDRISAEKRVLADKAHKLMEDKRRELTAELEVARADWDTAQAREQEHQQRLIPAAEVRLGLAETNYAAGRQSLAEVWEARRAVLEVQIAHWQIVTDLQRAIVKLGYLLNDNRLFPES